MPSLTIKPKRSVSRRCLSSFLVHYLFTLEKGKENPMETFNTETNKKIVQQYFLEMWNKKDFGLIDKLLSEDYKHNKPDGTMTMGRDHIRNVLKFVFDTYPDVQWAIKLQVAEGDLVATYIEGEAKNPNKAHFKEAFYHRIKDGLMIEGWVLPVLSK